MAHSMIPFMWGSKIGKINNVKNQNTDCGGIEVSITAKQMTPNLTS